MVGVSINPVEGLPSGFPVLESDPFIFYSIIFTLCRVLVVYFFLKFFVQELLRFILEHIEDKQVEALLEVCTMQMLANFSLFEPFFLFLFPNDDI